MKILFIGSSTSLSIQPLLTLIKSNETLCAIAADETTFTNSISDIKIYNSDSHNISEISLSNNIPYIELSKNISEDAAHLKSLDIDLLLVSCFARKIPANILSLARIGSFNLHPSLLPAFRGPTPLFWQFRAGVEKLSVTLHRMQEGFDDGNIILQKSVNKKDGISYTEANQLVAELAADVLIESLPLLSEKKFNETQQKSTHSNYQSQPTIKDYYLCTKWTAQHMYNFICASVVRNQLFTCQVEGVTFHIIRAISFNMNTYQLEGYQIDDQHISLACSKGVITCQLASDPL